MHSSSNQNGTANLSKGDRGPPTLGKKKSGPPFKGLHAGAAELSCMGCFNRFIRVGGSGFGLVPGLAFSVWGVGQDLPWAIRREDLKCDAGKLSATGLRGAWLLRLERTDIEVLDLREAPVSEQ